MVNALLVLIEIFRFLLAFELGYKIIC